MKKQIAQEKTQNGLHLTTAVSIPTDRMITLLKNYKNELEKHHSYKDVETLLQKAKKENNYDIITEYGGSSNASKYGRYYPSFSLSKSLSKMQGTVRNTLYKDLYVEIDMKNCAYTIVYQLTQKYATTNSNIKNYIQNREKEISSAIKYLNTDRKGAKEYFINMITTSYYEDKDNKSCIKKEMYYLYDTLKKSKEYKALHSSVTKTKECKDKPENIQGSFMAILAQDIERRIFLSAVELLKKHPQYSKIIEYKGDILFLDYASDGFYVSTQRLKDNNVTLDEVVKYLNENIYSQSNWEMVFEAKIKDDNVLEDVEWETFNEDDKVQSAIEFMEFHQGTSSDKNIKNACSTDKVIAENFLKTIRQQGDDIVFYNDHYYIWTSQKTMENLKNKENNEKKYYKKWFCYKNGKEGNSDMMENYLNVVFDSYKQHFDVFADMMVEPELLESCQEIYETIHKCIGSAKNSKNIVCKIRQKVAGNDFFEGFDNNLNLIGFDNNKVWDYTIKDVREMKKEDYISIGVGYDYVEETEENKKKLQQQVNKAMIFLYQLMNSTENYRFLKHFCASLLQPIKQQKYAVFNASGSNGKSQLTNLLKLVYGDYFATVAPSVICANNSNGEGATQNKMDLVSKRGAGFPEPDANQKVSNSVTKGLRGDGNFNARGLYEKTTTHKNNLITFYIECNKRLDYAETLTYGDLRSIIDLHFTTKFTTQEDIEEYQKQQEKNKELLKEEVQEDFEKVAITDKEILEVIEKYQKQQEKIKKLLKQKEEVQEKEKVAIIDKEILEAKKEFKPSSGEIVYRLIDTEFENKMGSDLRDGMMRLLMNTIKSGEFTHLSDVTPQWCVDRLKQFADETSSFSQFFEKYYEKTEEKEMIDLTSMARHLQEMSKSYYDDKEIQKNCKKIRDVKEEISKICGDNIIQDRKNHKTYVCFYKKKPIKETNEDEE